MKTIMVSAIIAALIWVVGIAISFAENFAANAMSYYILMSIVVIGSLFIIIEILRTNTEIIFFNSIVWMNLRKRFLLIFLAVGPLSCCKLLSPFHQNCFTFIHEWIWVLGFILAAVISIIAIIIMIKSDIKGKFNSIN